VDGGVRHGRRGPASLPAGRFLSALRHGRTAASPDRGGACSRSLISDIAV
jgi:hypothetical protein